MIVGELIEILKDCPQGNKVEISIDYENNDKMGWYVDIIEVEDVEETTEIRAFLENEVK